MRVRVSALVLVALAVFGACGARKSGDHRAECPATYDVATHAVIMCHDTSDDLECSYPGDGTCACGFPPNRGGSECSPIAPDPHEGDPQWVCSKPPPPPPPPTPPGALRPDGCPLEPAGACSEEGRSCRYSEGCGIRIYTCKDAFWRLTEHAVPA